MRFGSHFGALQHSTLPLPPKQPNTKKKHHFIPGTQVLCLCNLGCILVLFCSIKISGQSLSPKWKKIFIMTHLKNLLKGIQSISGDRHQFWSMKLPPGRISLASNYHLPFPLSSKATRPAPKQNTSVSPNQCLKNAVHSTVQGLIYAGF